MKSHRLLIRFNHSPEDVMELFTSLLGENNYVTVQTSYGVVTLLSKSEGAYIALLARLQINQVQYREIKMNYSTHNS